MDVFLHRELPKKHNSVKFQVIRSLFSLNKISYSSLVNGKNLRPGEFCLSMIPRISNNEKNTFQSYVACNYSMV